MASPTFSAQLEVTRDTTGNAAMLDYARVGYSRLTSDGDDSVQWATLTGLQEFEIIMGRQDELSRVEPSTLRLALNNESGIWSPETAGASISSLVSALGVPVANSNVLPRRRIRVKMTLSGVDYPLFYGHVRRWRPDFRAGDQRAWVEATDSWLKLARYKSSDSLSSEAMGTRIQRCLDLVGHPSERYALHCTAASSQYVSIADNASLSMGAGVRMAFCAWVKLDSKPANATVLSKFTTAGNQRAFMLRYVASDDRFEFFVSSAGTAASQTIVAADAFGSPTIATWYFVCCRYDGTNIYISVNGGAENSASFSADIFDDTSIFELGGAEGPFGLHDGAIQCVGIWKNALSTTLRTTLYNGGRPLQAAELPTSLLSAVSLVSYWNLNELSGTRYDNYGTNDLAPSAAPSYVDGLGTWRDIDSGFYAALAARSLSNTYLAQHLQDVLAIEDGILWFGGDGCAHFHNRAARSVDSFSTTSQATFGGTAGYGYRDPVYELGDDLIENVERITRTGGTEQVASDVTSITEYQETMYSTTSPDFQTDADALDFAQWRLARRKNPTARLKSITLEGGGDDGLWLKMATLQMSHRITVINQFPGNNNLNRDFWVEGKKWRIAEGGGRVELQLLLSGAESSAVASGQAVLGFARLDYDAEG